VRRTCRDCATAAVACRAAIRHETSLPDFLHGLDIWNVPGCHRGVVRALPTLRTLHESASSQVSHSETMVTMKGRIGHRRWACAADGWSCKSGCCRRWWLWLLVLLPLWLLLLLWLWLFY